MRETLTVSDRAPGVPGAMVAYLAFAGVAILATAPTAIDLGAIWATSTTYLYGFFVAPAALWMVLSTRGEIADAGGFWPGVLIVAAGAVIWLFGFSAGLSLLEQTGLTTLLIGGVGALFGARYLTVFAWPLLFLYLMVPAGDIAVPVLQAFTAQAAVFVLNAIGFDIWLDGVLIYTSVGVFAVAEACAGLNLLIASVMLAALFAHFSFQTLSARAGFVLLVIAAALVANTARAVVIILIQVIDGDQSTGLSAHGVIGVSTHAVVLIGCAWVASRFSKKQPRERAPISAPDLKPMGAAFALAVIAAASAYANVVVAAKSPTRDAPATLSLLAAPGWRILPPPQNWRPSAHGADRSAAATYDQKGERVYLTISYYTHYRRDAEAVSSLNRAWDGAEWRWIGDYEAVAYVFGVSEQRRYSKNAGPDGRRLLALEVFWVGDDVFLEPGAAKLALAKERLRGGDPETGKFIMAAAYNDDPAEASTLLVRYLASLETFSDWRARNRKDLG
ncbi:MAG: exosortase C-terminal domain/associated protein EpsI [Pseudomonadota bacterium]